MFCAIGTSSTSRGFQSCPKLPLALKEWKLTYTYSILFEYQNATLFKFGYNFESEVQAKKVNLTKRAPFCSLRNKITDGFDVWRCAKS